MVMETYLPWVIAGFALILVELITGTFYLLVIGLAALAGGLVAWLNKPFWMQAAAAVIVAVAGVMAIHRKRAAKPGQSAGSSAIDVGQMVKLESWISEADGYARVHYRGALWDARVSGNRPAGDVYFIHGVDGNVLLIAADKT